MRDEGATGATQLSAAPGLRSGEGSGDRAACWRCWRAFSPDGYVGLPARADRRRLYPRDGRDFGRAGEEC
jgi:hypothetical protein